MATYRGTWSLTCRMVCAYSIGAPIGAGQISREKHYHPLHQLVLHIIFRPMKSIILHAVDGCEIQLGHSSHSSTFCSDSDSRQIFSQLQFWCFLLHSQKKILTPVPTRRSKGSSRVQSLLCAWLLLRSRNHLSLVAMGPDVNVRGTILCYFVS